jgi:phosphoribosylglycinamide formyltransferase-1
VKRVVILISGRGSNLRALLEARLPAQIAGVISNETAAAGLAIAQSHGVSTQVVSHRDFADRDAFDRALAAHIDPYAPDLVVLAGFMRVLTAWFTQRYLGRLINVHPSLLPAFPGLHTHRRALEEGVRVHGCTVHFVTPRVDHGPIIVQAVVPVLQDDNEDTLAQRVLAQEHHALPLAARWFLDERVRLDGERVIVRGGACTERALICPEAA